MITRAADGVTLNYTKADGTPGTAGVFDSDLYSQLLQTLDQQNSAAIANKTNFNNYAQAVANAQLAVNAGQQPQQLPSVPQQINVSDQGVFTYTNFANLPVLVPNTTKVVPSINTFPAAPSVDKQGIMYNMITAIYNKTFPPAS